MIKHLKDIYFNNRPANFIKKNLSYLSKNMYDPKVFYIVYNSLVVGYQDLETGQVFTEECVGDRYTV